MSMQCRKVSNQLIAYLKSELTQSEAERVKLHLATCQRCCDEAHVLGNAFNDIARLPTFHISYDINAVEEAARRREAVILVGNWWRLVPAAACATVIVVLGFLLFNHFSTSQIARRPRPFPKPQIPAVAPIQNPSKSAPNEIDQQQIAKHPSKTYLPKHPGGERQVASSGSNRKRRDGTRRQQHHIPHEDATPTPQAIQNSPWDDSGPSVDAQTLIAQYVDTMAMCMVRAERSRTTISCAISPITTSDEDDLPVADTLTAAIICTFNDRHVTIDTNRLPPSMTGADLHPQKPNTATVVNIVDSVTDEYVIVGSVEKAKTGYLLSLYAINRTNDTVVFNGDHPILLPEDAMPQLSGHDMVSNRKMIALSPSELVKLAVFHKKS